ncbi:suppressor of cytokine signaling 2 isoform X1 [Mus musculus]|uniref:suppressor of cytokine signaling 2 isoform X1 n=1 Tax=Mus musculus TaxID=10090 RepID=UPI0007EC9AA1|nr:suppressor of cytokine signaling 2 isoform X1 [Mus musculus]XP_017169386.1 suppressor of cytokine signaling 2 isoform X1 [Mus musculus]XP_017169387.1 suppressor of cytokine signaling 2 isoform X1 [Mus musculus]XP_017169388.1 suppressor of cytokine signaling 2 isoform X1 [Mus musculus]XP_017169389.1 suppressor of cytokine signaling 2 isoform X1 [Mus musculus]|eukprot:XP_017169385.1 PREDICTED: suppressor of cytokine signaling 2 isoform X1 [Mus musculus]
MTLRCLEPSGNGADRTRSQWGTAGLPEEQSPEAARLAKALRELSQTGWYWGSMTVNEAKEKLKEAPEGTFLIRDSSHSDYLLTISVKTSAGPTNLRIEYQDGKFRLDSIICVKSKLKQFDSVVHLIDYYVQMCKDKRTGPEAPRNGTVHLYLTKPLYTSAPTLQHFCRLAINKCTGTIWGLPLPTRLKDYLEEYKFQENQGSEMLGDPPQVSLSQAEPRVLCESPAGHHSSRFRTYFLPTSPHSILTLRDSRHFFQHSIICGNCLAI